MNLVPLGCNSKISFSLISLLFHSQRHFYNKKIPRVLLFYVFVLYYFSNIFSHMKLLNMSSSHQNQKYLAK